MKFSISVHSDDGAQIDYSVDLLSAANAVSFINGWQAQQEAAQQSVQADGLDSWGNLGKCTICGKAWQECSCLARR